MEREREQARERERERERERARVLEGERETREQRIDGNRFILILCTRPECHRQFAVFKMSEVACGKFVLDQPHHSLSGPPVKGK